MQFVTLSFLALLGLSAAFEVTIYNNVDNCDANDQTTYRILTGSTKNCNTFGADMPGVACAQYTRGGWGGPDGCIGPLDVQSVFNHGGIASCTFYDQGNCLGNKISSSGVCLKASDIANFPTHKEYFGSFRCDH